MEIVRGDNRDESGMNGDFLCIKGRYAFDMHHHADRLKQPMVRKNGKLKLVTWEEAFEVAASKLKEIWQVKGGDAIGVIGSTRTTNEENYLLQKFARSVLGTNNIDHHRTADYPAFAASIKSRPELSASLRDIEKAPAVLLIGNDATEEHPLLAVTLRNNVRLHGGRLYTATHKEIKLKRKSAAHATLKPDGYSKFLAYLDGDDSVADAAGDKSQLVALRNALKAEENIVIVFGAELRGTDIATLVKLASSHKSGKVACLGDYANSRGAAEMGLYPDLLPGYTPLESGAAFAEEYGERFPKSKGMNLEEMVAAAKSGKLAALLVVGANPLGRYNVQPGELKNTFVIVQEMFLTETAAMADVVFPAVSSYEKSGTMTNTYGDLQMVKKAGDYAGGKPDFELIVRMATALGADVKSLVPFGQPPRADLGQSRGAQSGEADRHSGWLIANKIEPKVSALNPEALLDEIQRLVPGYDFNRLSLFVGSDVRTNAIGKGLGTQQDPKLIKPAHNSLFESGTFGRYSQILASVMEKHRNTEQTVTR